MIFLTNKDEDVVSPLLWKANTIPTVCKSVKAVETRAADKTVDDAVYIARTVHEIFTGERGEAQLPVDVLTDSQSMIYSINSTRQIEDKLLRPFIKYMKQCLDSRMINQFRWCETTVCLADIFTKSSAPLIDVVLKIVETNQMIDTGKITKERK